MEEEIRETIDAQKIQETLQQLNSLLSNAFYKLDFVDPQEISLLDKNAHYMPHEMFENLTNNIKRDGALASLPLCYRDDKTPLTVLSGNHRVYAAVHAKLSGILILVIDRRLSRQEQISIQLSHNALHGKDDPVILKELWEELQDIDLKLYSGLDTELLKDLEKMEFVTISDAMPDFKQINFLFLPEEIDTLRAILKDVDDLFSDEENYICSRQHYDAVFSLLVEIKDRFNIVSNPTAFMKVVEMARDHMATLPPPEPKKQPVKKDANNKEDNHLKSTT